MEIIRGTVISEKEEERPKEEVKIEYMTDPVPVHKGRISFITVLFVQAALCLLFGVLLRRCGDAEVLSEFLRRLMNG